MSTTRAARSDAAATHLGRQQTSAVHMLGWLAAGLLGWPISELVFGPGACLLTMSSLSLALGMWFFWIDGGNRRITPVGVYSFSFALFVGYAGINLHGTMDSYYDISFLASAVVVAYFTQVLIVAGLPPAMEVECPRARSGYPRETRWGVLVGLVLTAVGTAGALAGLSLFGLVDATAFCGVTLLAFAIFQPQTRGLGLVLRGGIVAGGFLAYALFVFAGFGRLTIGTLGIAIILALDSTKKFSARSLKLVTLAATVPTLVIFAETRVEFTAQLNPNQTSSVTGLESVVSPLLRFGQLLTAHGIQAPPNHYGESFVASATIFVPRQLWPDKPVGLGADLAHLFRPDLDGTGHSELALIHGEWLYNFGLPGLLMMVLVGRFALKRLNQWQVQLEQHQPLANRKTMLTWVMLILVIAGLPDLAWGGTFTFMSRTGFRVAVLAVVLLLFGLDANRRSGRPNQRSPDQ